MKKLFAAAMVLAGSSGAWAQEPSYPSPEWGQREMENYARTLEAPIEQLTDPDFMAKFSERFVLNAVEIMERNYVNEQGEWFSAFNLCASWSGPCMGDPYRYDDGTDPFYAEDGDVFPVTFMDSDGARLSGRVWMPKDTQPGAQLPVVVITTGSVQAPETLYWWAAQDLVKAGYAVMTFDVRGQGRSDSQTPEGTQGSNANPDVFVTNTIDAVDFFLSTPTAHYLNNEGTTNNTPYNPIWDRIDRARIGLVGHSLGATGVSIVQGIEPWPGHAVSQNPVIAIVAWDNLNGSASLAGHSVTPRVPAMGQSADYGLTPTPYTAPPDARGKSGGFDAWDDAGLATMQVTIRGGTHYEWSLIPLFPASSWDAGTDDGWGNPLARHYTLAWLDRYMKSPGEKGYDDADDRLMADGDWSERMSFYYDSSRHFTTRAGELALCTDIKRQDCF